MNEDTSHGLDPVPMAGQRIVIENMKNGVRVGQYDRKMRPGTDGVRREKIARTREFTPFAMAPFRGAVETMQLGGGAETSFLCAVSY
jgi:hypothetical protein